MHDKLKKGPNFQNRMENFERNGPKVDLQNTFIVHEKPRLDQNLLLEFKAHPQHNTTQHSQAKSVS